MSEDERAGRVQEVFSLMPADSAPMFSLVEEISGLIRPMTDEGTSMDSGGGMGSANLWFTVGGQEYVMTIVKSKQGAQAGPVAPEEPQP